MCVRVFVVLYAWVIRMHTLSIETRNIVEAHCHVVELEMERISVTAEEGPRGRNVLLLTSMPRELLTNSPHFMIETRIKLMYRTCLRRSLGLYIYCSSLLSQPHF